MGPRPDGRGTVIRLPPLDSIIWLQWGRDRMAAERELALFGLNAHGVASMGPRPDGRGTTSMASVIMRRSFASMGPRPDGRGTGRPVQCRRQSRSASMGPRPDGRGTGCIYDLPFSAYIGFNGAATGWPRNAAATTARQPRRRASMGPRPDGRGTKTGRPVHPARCHSFNGAATGWPRNVVFPEPCMPKIKSFNGAATGWPRNESTPPAARNIRKSASMGPRPDGRGTAEDWFDFRAGGLASMGPRPDGRGTLWSCSRAEYAPPASMGPRPDGRGTGQIKPAYDLHEGLQWGRDRMAAERRRPR